MTDQELLTFLGFVSSLWGSSDSSQTIWKHDLLTIFEARSKTGAVSWYTQGSSSYGTAFEVLQAWHYAREKDFTLSHQRFLKSKALFETAVASVGSV